MLGILMSEVAVRLGLASILCTLGTGRTSTALIPSEDYAWKKTVVAESSETGFSASIIQEWKGDEKQRYFRVWLPDDVSEPTLDFEF